MVAEVAVSRGGVAAAIVEGSQEVLLLQALDAKGKALRVAGSAALPGRGVAPMSAQSPRRRPLCALAPPSLLCRTCIARLTPATVPAPVLAQRSPSR